MCISNRYGFNVIDDYQFEYRKPNGEIKTKHWLVSEVVEGSPVNAGIRSGYNIEAIDGVLDDSAPIANEAIYQRPEVENFTVP